MKVSHSAIWLFTDTCLGCKLLDEIPNCTIVFAKNLWCSPFWSSPSTLPILPWPKPCASPFLFPMVSQSLLDFTLMVLWVISWLLLAVSYPGLSFWQMPLQQTLLPCCRSLAHSSIHLVMLPSSKQGLEGSVRAFWVTACDPAECIQWSA